MKKFNKILLVLLVPFNLFSQSLEIDWGASFDSKSEVEKILGFIDDKMFTLSTKGKKYYIDQFNADGYSLEASNEYEVPDIAGHQSGLLNIAIAEKDIVAIVYGYSKKTKSFILYGQTLNINGQQDGDMKVLYQSEEDDGKIKNAIVDVRFSPNNKKLLVFFDRNDKEAFTFSSDIVVIDLATSGLKTFSEKYTFSMRDMSSERSSFSVRHEIENDGSYYFVNNKTEFDKKTITNYELYISGFDMEGNKIGESVITDSESMLLTPALVKTSEGYTVVGYYQSNPKKRARVTGYAGLFAADLDNSLGLVSIKKNKFSNEFFGDLYSQRKIKRMTEKDEEILVPAAYNMDKIVLHSDGNITVLSELYEVIKTTNQNKSTTTTTIYGGIIYYKLNPEGDLIHSDIVKKIQMSSTTSMTLGGFSGGVDMFISFETKDKMKKYWSYNAFVKDDVIYLVYNDHSKNEENEDGEVSRALKNPKQGFPFLVTINPDGSFEKKGMADASDSDTYCVPQVTFNKDANSFVIWGVKRKENKFGNAVIK